MKKKPIGALFFPVDDLAGVAAENEGVSNSLLGQNIGKDDWGLELPEGEQEGVGY